MVVLVVESWLGLIRKENVMPIVMIRRCYSLRIAPEQSIIGVRVYFHCFGSISDYFQLCYHGLNHLDAW